MQEAVNKALVDLLYTLEMQGFGVGWMRGGSVNPMVDDATITVGPGRMIQLPQDGELGFAATQAPIDEVVGAIDRLMKWCAVSNGLPGSSMDIAEISVKVNTQEAKNASRDIDNLGKSGTGAQKNVDALALAAKYLTEAINRASKSSVDLSGRIDNLSGHLSNAQKNTDSFNKTGVKAISTFDGMAASALRKVIDIFKSEQPSPLPLAWKLRRMPNAGSDSGAQIEAARKRLFKAYEVFQDEIETTMNARCCQR